MIRPEIVGGGLVVVVIVEAAYLILLGYWGNVFTLCITDIGPG